MNGNATVLTVTDQDFAEQVWHSSLPVIVDFTASWCPPCRALAPVFEKLSQTYAGKLRFARMDTDENLQTPVQVGVQGIPHPGPLRQWPTRWSPGRPAPRASATRH